MLQVSFVGATEEAAREAAQKNGYGDKVAVVKTSFKANSKVGPALAGIANAALLDDCMWVWPCGHTRLQAAAAILPCLATTSCVHRMRQLTPLRTKAS